MTDNRLLSEDKTTPRVNPTAVYVREYTKVTNEQRELLINLLESNISIKNAARRAGLKYENAKVIYRVYKMEGRTSKKIKRQRQDLSNPDSMR